jgi:hypothetical protein
MDEIRGGLAIADEDKKKFMIKSGNRLGFLNVAPEFGY